MIIITADSGLSGKGRAFDSGEAWPVTARSYWRRLVGRLDSFVAAQLALEAALVGSQAFVVVEVVGPAVAAGLLGCSPLGCC